jgi:lysophospholipase L1-like esterase
LPADRPAAAAALLLALALPALAPSGTAAPPAAPQRVPGILVPLNPEQNTIQNKDVLADLYDKLRDVAETRKGRVAILHVGDSHVEGGYFPGVVREGLQRRFGDAGRGLVRPSILGVYPKKWIRSVEIRQDVKALRLWAGLKDDEAGAGFEALAVFHDRGLDYFDFEVLDGANRILGKITSRRPLEWPGTQGVQISRIELPETARSVILRTAKDPRTNVQRYAQMYGVSLESGRSGVLYHSFGIIGANCDSLAKSPYFQKQLEYVQPDLVIVSLGTNDGSTPNFRKEDFTAKYEALLARIRETCPHSAVLLTTAPDSYFPRLRRRAAKPNPNMAAEREAVLDVAGRRRCAVWDLYSIMGGDGSMNIWRESALANLDNIHFTKEGYEQQGRLLLEALLKGYADAAARSR